ncbi:MAG: alkaline phosphatase family protein [Candidatus Kapabacteria bacterium]|nr:alkaline phosphatase family protein [Candidatus Kapabacteria bacterium]
MTFIRFTLTLSMVVVVSTVMVVAQKPPRLVVVVSFDQYRGDYPDLFARFTGSRGFARLQKEGAWFSQCFYAQANNITGPGHATLLTGCYPSRSGIVGNDFCDLRTGECVYCADDAEGMKSASQLETETIGDLLRNRDRRSKVVGVSLKDRAGILMAGRLATSCVWYDAKAALWKTSGAYTTPRWLTALNSTVTTASYSGRVWKTEISEALKPAIDTVSAEGSFPGGNSTFPHDVLTPKDPKFEASVMLSPFSITMVFDAASIALRKERLGKDSSPDVLCIGVSTPDYVGHVFGPDSREVQELYVHADRRLGAFIDELDSFVGRNNYILVITSDHGVAPIPEIVKELPRQQGARIDAGRIREAEIQALVDSVLTNRFGKPKVRSFVRKIAEPSIYLNDTAIAGLDRAEVLNVVVNTLRKHPGLGIVTTRDTMALGDCPDGVDEATCRYIRNSFHASRTGDIVIYPKRYWIIGANTATHGTPYDYDRYVPLMMLGKGIVPQRYTDSVAPVDIAPTLAKIFGLALGPIDGSPLPLK